MDVQKLELESIHYILHWFIINVVKWLELILLDSKQLVNQMVIGIWKCDYESGFGTLVNQMVIGFGNMIMKVESLELKWF